MTRTVTLLLLIAALPSTLAAQQLSDAERARMADYLEQNRQKLLTATESLTPEQWAFKPAPDRWSVAEVLEHITVSEVFVMQLIDERLSANSLTDEQKEELQAATEKIVPFMLDRSQRFQAPAPAVPDGRYGAAGEVSQAFTAQRDGLIEYVKTTDVDLHGHGLEHPAFGTIDGYQWLLFIAAHGERHLLQIEEVKSHPDFPRKATS